MKIGFKYALSGIVRSIRTEQNMRIHLCFCFYVILAGIVTGIDALRWVAVLLCMGLVTGAELFNTAIETLCDRLTREQDTMIGAAKDAAAGAVLACALFSAAVGCIIFFTDGRPATALAFAAAHPVAAAVIVLTLIPAVLFVKGGKNKK